MSTATSQPHSASTPARSSQPSTQPGAQPSTQPGSKKAAACARSRWASPALIWGTVIVTFFVLLALLAPVFTLITSRTARPFFRANRFRRRNFRPTLVWRHAFARS